MKRIGEVVLGIVSLAVVTGAQDFGASRALYSGMVSVHMRADVKIDRGDGVVGTGFYEYWADGDRYRINCGSDPALGLMADAQYAYNGTTFYALLPGADTLTIRPGDSAQLPTAFPNPLFLPVDYLNPSDDDCDSCALKLRDVTESSRLRRSRTLHGELLTARASEGRLQWLRPDGSVATTISFDPVGSEFPRHITLKHFNPSTKRWVILDASIGTLEVNTAIPLDTFELPTTAASRVWDEKNGHATPRQP